MQTNYSTQPQHFQGFTPIQPQPQIPAIHLHVTADNLGMIAPLLKQAVNGFGPQLNVVVEPQLQTTPPTQKGVIEAPGAPRKSISEMKQSNQQPKQRPKKEVSEETTVHVTLIQSFDLQDKVSEEDVEHLIRKAASDFCEKHGITGISGVYASPVVYTKNGVRQYGGYYFDITFTKSSQAEKFMSYAKTHSISIDCKKNVKNYDESDNESESESDASDEAVVKYFMNVSRFSKEKRNESRDRAKRSLF